MATRYLETNYLIGVALGREPAVDSLGLGMGRSFELAIPGICFMEALSCLKGERSRRGQFGRTLDQQINQLGRDVTSRHARSLLSHLQQPRTDNNKWLYEINSRLYQAIEQLCSRSTFVDLTSGVLAASCGTTFIEDPTDNLILHVILAHARSKPTEAKAFVSENSTDFESDVPKKAMGDVGLKYFRRTQAALGWLRSQTTS